MKKRYKIGILIFLLAFLLNIAARQLSGFAEWYASYIYPIFVNIISRVTSLLPFSIAEILLYVTILYCMFWLVRLVIWKKKKKITLKNAAGNVVGSIALILSWMFFIFTLMAGINYQRTPFSQLEGYHLQVSNELSEAADSIQLSLANQENVVEQASSDLTGYTDKELYELCLWLTGQINKTALEIEIDQAGYMVLPSDIEQLAVNSMYKLGEEIPSLSGYYPNAKGVLNSSLLSYQLIEGIYSPFTLEANYNRDMPSIDIPSAICHELSHLKGFMREDEANFIAYLACRESDYAAFRYSGYLQAYTYATNALYRSMGTETYMELRSFLCDQATKDLKAEYLFWNGYSGPISEAANKINDTYLKANSQSEGVKSYGRMVDLLLSDYMENIRKTASP